MSDTADLAQLLSALLDKLDEALADKSQRPLRAALDRALAAVQDLGDDDQPRRLTRAERLEAFAAIYTAIAEVADISKELMVGYPQLAGLSLQYEEEQPMIEVFDPDELIDVNVSQTGFRERLGRVAFFASDGGDGFYTLDANGTVAGKPGAVLWVDRGSSEWRVAAEDFTRFLSQGDPAA